MVLGRARHGVSRLFAVKENGDLIRNGYMYEDWVLNKTNGNHNTKEKLMGQYHLTVNLDKKEFLMPHKLGVGLKLREQLGSSDSTPDALFMLLACSNGKGGGDFIDYRGNFEDNQNKMCGRWAGDRVAVVGDYADKDSLPMMFGADSIYKLCHTYPLDCDAEGCTADGSSHYFDITDMLIPVMMMKEPGLYINTDEPGWRRREYMNPDGPEWGGDMGVETKQSLDSHIDLPF